jgi:hypothetical protein
MGNMGTKDKRIPMMRKLPVILVFIFSHPKEMVLGRTAKPLGG